MDRCGAASNSFGRTFEDGVGNFGRKKRLLLTNHVFLDVIPLCTCGDHKWTRKNVRMIVMIAEVVAIMISWHRWTQAEQTVAAVQL
jgi:hypothetical protein